MRRTFALVLFAVSAAAQPQIARLEKNVAAKPEDAAERYRLLNALVAPDPISGYPIERILELRRANVLWLIRSRPAADNWIQGEFLIPLRGVFGDPDGYAQTVAAWQEQISKPGATPEAFANAAIYLKATDRAQARRILDRALQSHPDAPALWHAVGIVDASAMAGVDGLAVRGEFSTDPALRESAEAERARREMEDSRNPIVLGGAAQMLFASRIQNFLQLAFGGDDAASLAERWLRRAVAIAPAAGELKNLLAHVLRAEAGAAEDPRERARLYSESFALTPDRDQPEALLDLAKAEFEAGNDAAAARDAQSALNAAPEAAKRNRNQAALLINRAQSILGRVALAHGDAAQARARLRASLDVPADVNTFQFNGPDLSLAQDLADAGETDGVVAYLQTARAFWLYDRGQLDRDMKLVRAGRKRAAFAPFQPSGFDLVRRPAPPFKARDLSGKEWTLASLGGKPCLLLFWNAACQICASQIDGFTQAAGSERVIAVNVGDDSSTAQAFVEKNHVATTVLLATPSMTAAYHVESVPAAVLIDARGEVARFQPGAAANPRQVLDPVVHPGIAIPTIVGTDSRGSETALIWRPVSGAQSYVVEWEERDQHGWPSDRDGFLRVIPTRDTQVRMNSGSSFRWRVYAVSSGSKGEPTPWTIEERSDLR